MRAKTLCRHQLEFSVFNELCRCCLQQWGLAVSTQRAASSFGNSLCCLCIPVGPLSPSASFAVTQFWYGSFLWWQEMVSWDSISPIVWLLHLGSFHMCVYFRKSTGLGFQTNTQRGLNFSCFSSYYHTPLNFFFPSPFDPQDSHLHPSIITFSIFLS